MFKKLAKIYALVAEMEAVKTEVIARQALNSERESLGQSLAYDEEVFDVYATSLHDLVDKFKELD